MLKLVGETSNIVPVNQMKDGDIAIIVEWPAWPHLQHIGDIVQRHGGSLVRLGGTIGHSWSNFFPDNWDTKTTKQVRILQSGELLEVE